MTISELSASDIITGCSVLISVLTVVLAFLKARTDGKTMAEALTLAINVLKVEDKMTPDGKFKAELVEKTEIAAKALQVGAEAKQKVQEELTKGQHEGDLKIGSIKGRPIYVGQVLGIGSSLAQALLRLRGLRK